MKIPADQLESTKTALRHLIDERTSSPFGGYSDEDLDRCDQDYEDIERLETVFDVYRFLRSQGARTVFIEYASCLDPLDGFKVEGKEPDEDDEEAFREYLTATYGIAKKEFYRNY
jgi:hypothetical protein